MGRVVAVAWEQPRHAEADAPRRRTSLAGAVATPNAPMTTMMMVVMITRNILMVVTIMVEMGAGKWQV